LPCREIIITAHKYFRDHARDQPNSLRGNYISGVGDA
jgi:hypothetical protein